MNFEELKDEYAKLWATCEVTQSAAVATEANAILGMTAEYKKCEVSAHVPWFVIGVMHVREAGLVGRPPHPDFAACLHNGERIVGTGRKTSLVPRGRGPFASFRASVVDACELEGLHKLDWYAGDGPARTAYALEKFNGFGYRAAGRSGRSPYLWAGTNHQLAGKFTSDGHYDAAAWDTQVGGMALLKKLMELDPSVSFEEPKPAPLKPTVTGAVTTGAAVSLTAAAAWLGDHPLAAGVAAYAAYALARTVTEAGAWGKVLAALAAMEKARR